MVNLATFSVAAYDPQLNAWGVAVASKFLAVGNIVPWVRAGAGAVATQAYANTRYGRNGLDRMAEGYSAADTLAYLLETDDERESRQLGLVDMQGSSATFTGSDCHSWAGGIAGTGYAIQGNILAGPEVINAMAETYEQGDGSFLWKMYHTLMAGDQAGGDRRGRQSAAIYLEKPGGGYGGNNDRWVDYRVDDHPDPVGRLAELLRLHELYFGESTDQEKLLLSGTRLTKLQDIMLQQGYYSGAAEGSYNSATKQALAAFIGSENFEERVDLDRGTIDQPVFEYLLEKFGAGS